MLEGLGNVVIKEIKELVRDPKILIGMIIVPILLFPFMGLAISVATQSARESIRTMSVGVIDQDQGNYSQALLGVFSAYNITVVKLNFDSIENAAPSVQESNMTAVVVMPQGVSQNITNNEQAKLQVYAVFRNLGIAETAGPSTVVALIDEVSRSLALQKVGNNSAILNPLLVSQESIVKGQAVDADPTVLSTLLLSQLIGVPIGISVILVFAMQIAATSVASEKEEKTLETMLTMPVSRFTILLGKLGGSVVVAAVGALAYVVGLNYYMGSLTFSVQTQQSINLGAIGLEPNLLGYAVLGVSLFITLVSALALAIAVSSFAEDVRGAQSLVGYFYFIIFIPMIFLLYTDISALPFALRLVLLAIPYTHPMLAARASITGDYTTAILGIVYVTIFTLVVLYIAAKIFTTEKILTMKLRLRRQRTKREE